MATYEKYEVQQLAKAQKQAAEYEAARKAQANRAAANVKTVYDTAIADAEYTYAAAAKETEAAYREVYDANVVDELVRRKHAEEAIRNMNLANSGLSNTEQTAISLQRGRADTQATYKKQAAVEALMRELDALRTEYTMTSAQKQADIHADADDDIAAYRKSLQEEAADRAFKLYTQAREEEKEAAEKAKDSGSLLGTRYAYSHVEPTEKSVLVDAEWHKRFQGEGYAWRYLDQQVRKGVITPEQRAEIVQEIGLREIDRPTDEEVETVLMSILQRSGKEDALRYITTLQKTAQIYTGTYTRLCEKWDLL